MHNTIAFIDASASIRRFEAQCGPNGEPMFRRGRAEDRALILMLAADLIGTQAAQVPRLQLFLLAGQSNMAGLPPCTYDEREGLRRRAAPVIGRTHSLTVMANSERPAGSAARLLVSQPWHAEE
jgi:hypothetical protein